MMGAFSDFMGKILGQASVPRPPDAAPSSGARRPGAGFAHTTAAVIPVDVAAVLNKLAAESKEKLDWKQSIVDLMKLVGMDSGLSARKELAADLRYTGDTNDSATMNVWLHKEVMRKLAANGGKVPAELLAH
jgi:hypothetical protein